MSEEPLFVADFDTISNFYTAYRRFHELANDPRNQVRFRLQPGEMMAFDKRRVGLALSTCLAGSILTVPRCLLLSQERDLAGSLLGGFGLTKFPFGLSGQFAGSLLGGLLFGLAGLFSQSDRFAFRSARFARDIRGKPGSLPFGIFRIVGRPVGTCLFKLRLLCLR